VSFLLSEESAGGDTCRTRYHHFCAAQNIQNLWELYLYRIQKIWKYWQSLSIAIVRRKTGTRSRVESGNPGAANLRFRDSHATHVTVRKTSIFSFTYWGQMKHFSEHVARRDTSVNRTTDGILLIDPDIPFVFIHDAFSLFSFHPMDSWWWFLVETRLICLYLPISTYIWRANWKQV